MDPLEQHRRELEATAAAARLARDCRGAGAARPSPVLRVYARLWWASRPRVAAWTPGLFDSPART